MHVFSAFFRIKSKLVDKMMQSNYLCVILDVKRRKVFIFTYSFSLFLPDFYFLIKSKMAAMFGDVTDLQQRHHP